MWCPVLASQDKDDDGLEGSQQKATKVVQVMEQMAQ